MIDSQSILPNDSEAERRVLSSVIFHKECLPIVQGILVTSDFYDPRNSLIYRTMLELDERGAPIEVGTIGAELMRLGKVKDAGGILYLEEVQNASATSESAEYYADIVRNKALRRSMMTACQSIVVNGSNALFETSDYLRGAKDSVQSIVDQMDNRTSAVLAGDYIDTAYSEAFMRTEPMGLVRTHISPIDDLVGGLWPSTVTVCASRPGMGKSTLALNIALNVAMFGKKVLFVSLEDPIRTVMWRIMSRLGRVDLKRIFLRNLSISEQNQLTQSRGVFDNLPLWIDDSGVMSSDEIRCASITHRDRHGLDLLIIDHLGHIREKAKSMYEGTTRAAQVIAQTAKELDIPVLLLHQLNRQCMGRTDTGFRPKVSDLRESGEIEQLARQIWLLHRSYEYFPDDSDPNEMELNVGKNTNGPKSNRKLYCDLSTMYVAGEPDNQQNGEW